MVLVLVVVEVVVMVVVGSIESPTLGVPEALAADRVTAACCPTTIAAPETVAEGDGFVTYFVYGKLVQYSVTFVISPTT